MGPLGIDYIHAYHCGFKEHGWLFYPCLLAWGCIITYLMGHTADAYFSPTLATLSDKVKEGWRGKRRGEGREYMQVVEGADLLHSCKMSCFS